MEIRITGYDHADARRLTAEVQQEYVLRYGDPDETEMHEDHFDPPTGLFLVGYLDGEPVACGGWRARTADPDGGPVLAGDAELKRMYVVPAARGRGLARILLRRLEHTAAEAGRARLILETGDRQPEAIALYRSEGYADIPKFGFYRDSPLCVCLGKPLNA